MPLEELIKDTKFWAGIKEEDDDSYPIADIIRNYNFNLDLIIMKAMRVSNTWQVDDTTYDNINIAYTDLIGNQDNYTLESDMIRIQRLRIKDINGNWITLNPKDRRELTDTDLGSTGTPRYYDKIGASLMLYPISDYSFENGIEIQYQRGGNYFEENNLSVIPGISVTSLRILSLKTALDYTETNEMESRSAKIRNRLAELEAETLELYSDRDRDGMPYMSVRDERDFTDNLFDN